MSDTRFTPNYDRMTVVDTLHDTEAGFSERETLDTAVQSFNDDPSFTETGMFLFTPVDLNFWSETDSKLTDAEKQDIRDLFWANLEANISKFMGNIDN